MSQAFYTRLGMLTLVVATFAAWAADVDEFKIKREEVFEFTEQPKVAPPDTGHPDRFIIRFASKAWCDVTIAVEDDRGRIVRHLASGVLGPNAPEPLVKNALAQEIVWDGKDDQGRYLDNREMLSVRVSLGLSPRFERTLFWSPYKRLNQSAGRWGFVGTQGGLPTPRIAAAPEGVYVYEGRGLDHLRLFDHQGHYIRTVYPFPGDKLDKVDGLAWHAFPQDGGTKLPLKRDILQTTFLDSGPSGRVEMVRSMFGTAATALAVRDGRIALVHRSLNRVAGDGSSGGLPLHGPETCFRVRFNVDGGEQSEWPVSPTSAAFSPDGKTLYCAGYMWRQGRHSVRIVKECLHGATRLRYETNNPLEVFAGSVKPNDSGTGDGQFRDATSVDCDSSGRVYVSDFSNDRIQVFTPEGKHLKNIAVSKPALVRVHRKTDEVFVFSWSLDHGRTLGAEANARTIAIPAQLTRLGPFSDPQPRGQWKLPLLNYAGFFAPGSMWGGLEYTAEIDSWAPEGQGLTVWLVPGLPVTSTVPGQEGGEKPDWERAGIKVLVERNGKLELLRDFARQAAKDVLRLEPPMWSRQRLYVNPTSGLLYLGEGQTYHKKAMKELLELTPETGAIREISLPFDAEDVAFDAQGHIYLKSPDAVLRFEMPAWREVPFDYGDERKDVSSSSSTDRRRCDAISALPLYNGTGWHKGGIFVNLKGHILTSSLVTKGDAVPFLELRTDEKVAGEAPKARYYTPVIYPGRLRMGEIHVWDKHGKMQHEDVVQGLVDLYGVGLDKDDNVYVMAAPTRILDGERYFDGLSGTLIKFKPGEGKVISQNSNLIPVPVTDPPKRPHDMIKGTSPAWVEGAEWFYGGVGYCGKNVNHCACWNARFALDYFARSFAPEVRRFSVAVLDSNGNLIMRIGRVGNVDEGRPLVLAGGPADPRTVGGDEVVLFHGAYVATHTDRRLFIADPGNARILSVKLGYHQESRIPLKTVLADK